MHNNASPDRYVQRLHRVTDYLYRHLDQELNLNTLAEVACLSPYHWHRVYHAIYGESIITTVKRLRLHRAAGYLANTDMPVADVADRSGYDNLQSFTRIFKAEYGLPPAQYRKHGSHNKFKMQTISEASTMYQVDCETRAGMQLIGVDHRGSYMDIGQAFANLYGVLGARNQLQPAMRMIGVYFDDPQSVAEDQLRSRACVTGGADLALAPPLSLTSLAAGDYAVLRHRGPYADMRAAYQWLYGVWLPNSGREPADAPVFEEYLNNPRDTAPADLLTAIYLPLR